MVKTEARGEREPAPRTIECLPEGYDAESVEAWKAYAVVASERYCYAYTLFELAAGGYLLVKSCEQDFFHFYPNSSLYLRPEGRHLGFTMLIWRDHELHWTFWDWPAGPKEYSRNVGPTVGWYGQVPP